jgi:hypothetical protein
MCAPNCVKLLLRSAHREAKERGGMLRSGKPRLNLCTSVVQSKWATTEVICSVNFLPFVFTTLGLWWFIINIRTQTFLTVCYRQMVTVLLLIWKISASNIIWKQTFWKGFRGFLTPLGQFQDSVSDYSWWLPSTAFQFITRLSSCQSTLWIELVKASLNIP